MAIRLQRHVFTADEYHRMGRAGIFSEDDRVELIEGEIIEMTPIGSRHAACIKRFIQLFSQKIGQRALVDVQNPVRLGGHSEPVPDMTLLRLSQDFYSTSHPGPEDVFLIIEVAETSAEYDRTVKLPLYAKNGIPEFWLVDLAHDRIEVYRQPSSTGYIEVRTFRRGQHLSTLAFPDLDLSVDAIL